MVKWRDLEMRKLFNLFAAALVMLVAASCEKNETLPDNNSEGKVVTLKASINNGETRTSLGAKVDDIYPVLWSAGDAISVIQGSSAYTFVLSPECAGETSGTFMYLAELAPSFNPEENYTAFYPANSVSVNDVDGTVQYTILGTQYYAENSFGSGTMPMAATSTGGTSFIFNNLFGVLKLQLKGAANEKVTSIVVTSDKALNGEAQLDGGAITLQGTSDENKKVTLDCSADGGVVLNPETATDFHIALPAGVHELSVCFVTNKGVYYKTTEQTIESGKIIKMASLNTESKGEPGSDFPNGNMSYVENGVYLGEGVALPAGEGKTIIWAPVNCGYDAVNFKYGKLYQWGRKDGQGYYYDETFANNDLGGGPTSITTGPISWESYIEGNYSNVFIKEGSTDDVGDWLSSQDPDLVLWGNGIKTDHDPCPAGWRVPTSDEMKSLSSGFSTSNSPGASDKNKENFDSGKGYYFYGVVTDEASAVNKVFFPAAGCLLRDGSCESLTVDDDDNSKPTRGYLGNYWTSTTNGAFSHSLIFGKKYDSAGDYNGGWYYLLRIKENSQRACGFSVRCVKDMTQSQPMPGSN